ncbi:hypothetical protein AB0M29_38330 [Streptomyces sp. NPDC051976]|uniref:hypothetical protein n=1 Tax=Streptomyces sp. NPDC051976 TaxID=3154947 RepID=UPI003434BB23
MSGGSLAPGKYARVERERRFLMAGPPAPEEVTATRVITDRYLVGTRLRLRRVDFPDGGGSQLKLTQKVPAAVPYARVSGVQGLITNTYLSWAEYELLSTLPGEVLVKTRFSVPPLGVDVFGGVLRGLVVGEVEFADDEEARGFVAPGGCVAEVTDDVRFTGGRLVVASREDLLGWLAEYGLRP